MPLFTRFRQAFGEERPLIEAPGQGLAAEEIDGALSIILMSQMFAWDCSVFSGSGRHVVFTSHDEFCWFASRDLPVAELAQRTMARAFG